MSFLRDERGAVTIEWVVLTAGVIALGITAYAAFKIDTKNTTAVFFGQSRWQQTHHDWW